MSECEISFQVEAFFKSPLCQWPIAKLRCNEAEVEVGFNEEGINEGEVLGLFECFEQLT